MLWGAPFCASAEAAGRTGSPPPQPALEFNVHLPLRNEAELEQLVRLQSDPHSPLFHHYLSVAQFRASYGPAPETVARAAAALRARGLVVTSMATQSLRVRGTRAHVESAFRTRLSTLRESGGAVLARTTPLTMPRELAALNVTVSGLEPRLRMHVHSRTVPRNRYAAYGPYWFDDLKEAYTYPSDQTFDGAGATVGVLMDSDVLDTDTDSYFAHERYETISKKTRLPLIHEAINGGGGFAGADFPEASLDVQTAQGSAPGAQLKLYNVADLSDGSILGGYITAIDENAVDVLSSSFGGCEVSYFAAYNHGIDQTGILRVFDHLFTQGNAQGITFVASSGDGGALGCYPPSYLSGASGRFIPGVEFPADDPHVTGVGGTNLQTTAPGANASLRSVYVAENAVADPEVAFDPYGFGGLLSNGVWASGSGSSAVWDKPWYQYLVQTGSARRTVPDISMQMGGCPSVITPVSCPAAARSGSVYVFAGGLYEAVGTSLAAPEFAGLLAVRIGMTATRLGNANGYIYEVAAANDALPPNAPAPFLHEGIPGSNGLATIPGGRRGYSPLVGVGTPFGARFIGAPLPLAGDPQTPGNP